MKFNIERFKTICQMSIDDIMQEFISYKAATLGNGFIHIPGNIPILLVAHCDTVFEAPPKSIITYKAYTNMDSKKLNTIIESSDTSDDGLGADDRAGIYMLDMILNSKGKQKPSILICDGEEKGAYGARNATKREEIFDNINLIIELDRQGSMQYVTYDCENPIMNEYMEGYGYKQYQGNFSDISILAPAAGIAACNISVGYYQQHTRMEYLVVEDFMQSYTALQRILKSPPTEKMEYIEIPYDDCMQSCNEDIEVYISGDDLNDYDIDGDVNWNDLLWLYYDSIMDIAKQAAIKEILKNKQYFVCKDKDKDIV